MILGPHIITKRFDYAYKPMIRALAAHRPEQPYFVKMVNGDAGLLRELLELSPNVVVIDRDHPLSEEHNSLRQNPEATGRAHAISIAARRSGWGMSRETRLIHEGINEFPVWQYGDELLCRYATTFVQAAAENSFTPVTPCLNTGWPAIEPAWPEQPDNPAEKGSCWSQYEPLARVLQECGGYLGLHAYWGVRGPLYGYNWQSGRHSHCPFDVSILITECGFDAAVDGLTDPKKRWWTAFMDGPAYALQLAQYEARLREDNRVKGAQLFTLGFQSEDWRYSSYQDIWQEIVRAVQALPPAEPVPELVEGIEAPVAAKGVEAEPSWSIPGLAPWKELIQAAATASQLDPHLVAAVIMLESGGDPAAVSPAGAVGLMQVMPREAGAAFEDRPGRSELLEPALNIAAGCRILRQYIDFQHGDLSLGLASYYAGPGVIRRQGFNYPPARRYLSIFAQTWQSLWPARACPAVLPPEECVTQPQPANPALPTAAELCQKAGEEARQLIELGKRLQNNIEALAAMLPGNNSMIGAE
jgi:soluble lytic murein transglycosylase-like protein